MNISPTKTDKAIFAGGCFWCMEPPFEKLDGVHTVVSGYTGGHKENPTYKEVCTGLTGHTEAIEICFDPTKVNFDQLLDVLWMNIDPTDERGQFADRGSQYRSGIYYFNEEQKEQAEVSREKLKQSGRFDRPIVTEIVAATKFYPAEDYHQNYYKVSTVDYELDRSNSGRDQFLKKIWGK